MGLLAATIPGLTALVIVFVIAWVLFWWLYRRAIKEVAFVRKGMGGQRVVQNGGAFVIPVLHDNIRVNMGTNRLEITRAEGRSVITRDRPRGDVTAAFHMRVGGNADAIALAAQSPGARTARPEACFCGAEDVARASAVETQSRSGRVKALAEAENTMTRELMALTLRMSVIEHLKEIIRESARPMENVNDIRILQVDGVPGGQGLGQGDGIRAQGGGASADGGRSLPDQLVGSALRYRTQAPVVDSLLAELGLKGSDPAAVWGYLAGQFGPQEPAPDGASGFGAEPGSEPPPGRD